MKPHRILKDFKGSQTGIDGPHEFVEGTVADLSDSLAETAIKAGFAEPHKGKAPVTDDPEKRETKVTAPEEKKPLMAKITGKKTKQS